MTPHNRQLKTLLLRLLLITVLFTLCRALFYCFNYSYFSSISFGELLRILFYGIKFDLPAILIINLPFIILSLLPIRQRELSWFRQTLKLLFLTTNAVALVANCIDFVYFKFTLKRTTADIFAFINTGDDFTRLLPLFIKDYWFLFIFFFVMLWIMIRYFKKAEKTGNTTEELSTLVYFRKHSLIFVLALAFFTILYRGGFQLKPISIITAGQYVSARNIPLLISTPFSIIKTIEQEGIKEVKYFDEQKLQALYSPLHSADTGTFKNMNVVILIMESFSKEYIGGLNNNQGYTPFLDSLMQHSLVFENAFANGKRSMEGIPACVAGIPTLMNEPYITSRYGGNNIRPLAVLLKEKGYNTSFYHAATNGSMGFDNFTKLAGFDNYFGRLEYNNEEHFDGHWGIWDEEFFQYFVKGLDKTQQPFLSAFFSLTSHHPYPVPERYSKLFREGDIPIERSISYSDYSLRKFFQTASRSKWFDNTLFVIVADHTGEAHAPYYSSNVGMFRIPVMFYMHNSDLTGRRKEIVQQIDLMPSVLDYLDYDKDYFAYGESVFDTTANRLAYGFINNNYQLITDKYALQFDGEKPIALYNHLSDSLLQKDIQAKDLKELNYLQDQLKAFIQVYQRSLINNKMY